MVVITHAYVGNHEGVQVIFGCNQLNKSQKTYLPMSSRVLTD